MPTGCMRPKERMTADSERERGREREGRGVRLAPPVAVLGGEALELRALLEREREGWREREGRRVRLRRWSPRRARKHWSREWEQPSCAIAR